MENTFFVIVLTILGNDLLPIFRLVGTVHKVITFNSSDILDAGHLVGDRRGDNLRLVVFMAFNELDQTTFG